jgi:hypothetical protein
MYANLFATAVLLGLFVLAGGGYGIFYSTAMLRSSVLLECIGYVSYAIQMLIVLGLCIASPLNLVWKVFLAASGIAYGFIPPVLWRFLETMHRSEARSIRGP